MPANLSVLGVFWELATVGWYRKMSSQTDSFRTSFAETMTATGVLSALMFSLTASALWESGNTDVLDRGYSRGIFSE
jgi:hypothetical protein